MASSSKYIQISSSVLMEYVYSDQSQINVPGNEWRINVNTSPIWKMDNGNNNQSQIMNSDSSETVQDGLPIGTGNVRNRSFAIVESHKVALLDIDKIIFYNDYDNKLTNTSNLPITFTGQHAPVYDTIKLHLVQGFNFEENDSLILSVKARRKDGSVFILCNLVYNKTDVWETMNPSPFFFGGRIYNSYLEVRVLSLYNLIYDYWLGTLNGDTVVERITDGIGIMREQPISIYFSFANVTDVLEDQTYLSLIGTKTVDIPIRDQFESIGAYIAESTEGDYIEFYATYSNNIIDTYITDLNNNGYDFIILHDLIVYEYVYNASSGSYNWIKTEDVQLSQINEFDKANLYRPIIKNPSAISFKIDYTVRMYNREDNSQVWKTSSIISNSASKYGKIMKSINLGITPVQTKIYNKKVVKDISINRITEPVINNTKYITSFSNNSNISITSESINLSEGNSSSTLVNSPNTLQSGSSNLPVYTNGLGRIVIPNSSTYLKFTLFQKDNGNNKVMNLSGLGALNLVFTSNSGEDVEMEEFTSKYTSKGNGEIVFRISSSESKKILEYKDKTFKIFLTNESGDKTFLYSGTFYSIKEFNELAANDKIVLLQSQLDSLNKILTDQQNAISQTKTGNAETNTLKKILASQQSFINTFVGNKNNSTTKYTVPDFTLNEKYQNISDVVLNSIKSSVKGSTASNMQG